MTEFIALSFECNEKTKTRTYVKGVLVLSLIASFPSESVLTATQGNADFHSTVCLSFNGIDE